MRGLWKPGGFERGGNTKTHGIVRAEFIVHDGLPPQFRHGIFAQPKTYRAWVRFSGPGPYVTPDIDDVGFMSISIKLMGVPGPEADGSEEKFTQDMFGVSAADVRDAGHARERAAADREPEERVDLPLRELPPSAPPRLHHAGAVDQDPERVRSRRRTSSCVPYLLGEGQAMQYSVWPKSNKKTPIPRLPLRPPDDYLRQAMVAGARAGRRRARRSPPAADRSAPDADREQRRAVAGAAVAPRLGGHACACRSRSSIRRRRSRSRRRLSYNPWHCIAEHRPLGNQSRGQARACISSCRSCGTR